VLVLWLKDLESDKGLLMRFHIRRSAGNVHTMCGYEAYTSETEHLATKAAIENPNRPWFSGDSVCLTCIQILCPVPVKQIKACRAIPAGAWVVLCGCGEARPYATPCGHAKPLPLDRS
jgi:hypothetical protein